MNRQLRLFALLLCLVAAAMPRFNLRADTCDSLVCGDADGNGTYNINDLTYITSFLYGGGPAPALCGDIDGYDLITIRDIVVGAYNATCKLRHPTENRRPALNPDDDLVQSALFARIKAR